MTCEHQCCLWQKEKSSLLTSFNGNICFPCPNWQYKIFTRNTLQKYILWVILTPKHFSDNVVYACLLELGRSAYKQQESPCFRSMNWTDLKTIPSLLVGTYVCVYLVRVHTDYSWYYPCYTAFGIFKGCRNDLNVVMRGSLKSRTCVPISSFSNISNRQTIFSLNHRALLRHIRVFISEQQGFY